MLHVRKLFLAFAAAALVAGGCAHGGQNRASGGFGDGDTTLRVMNNNWSDMTIYMVRNGMRQRLGTVTSQALGVFRVPSHIVESSSSLYLVADPIGSTSTYTSSPIMVAPGQRMEWRLENAINLSSLWIR